MAPITVVIADRRKAGRAACRRLLRLEKGIRVAGGARSRQGALAAAARLKPRILLLALTLTPRDGVAVLPALRRKSPRSRVILLTRRASEARILDALSPGVWGYLDARALETFLAKAVRKVDAGEAWVPRKMVARVVDRLARFAAGGRVSYQSPMNGFSNPLIFLT